MEISSSEYKADAFALSQTGDLNGIVQTLKQLKNFVKTNYNPSYTLDRRVEKGVRENSKVAFRMRVLGLNNRLPIYLTEKSFLIPVSIAIHFL